MNTTEKIYYYAVSKLSGVLFFGYLTENKFCLCARRIRGVWYRFPGEFSSKGLSRCHTCPVTEEEAAAILLMASSWDESLDYDLSGENQ